MRDWHLQNKCKLQPFLKSTTKQNVLTIWFDLLSCCIKFNVFTGSFDFLAHYRLVDPKKVDGYAKAFVVEDTDFDTFINFKVLSKIDISKSVDDALGELIVHHQRYRPGDSNKSVDIEHSVYGKFLE